MNVQVVLAVTQFWWILEGREKYALQEELFCWNCRSMQVNGRSCYNIKLFWKKKSGDVFWVNLHEKTILGKKHYKALFLEGGWLKNI